MTPVRGKKRNADECQWGKKDVEKKWGKKDMSMS